MADLTGTLGPDNIPGTGSADSIRGLRGEDTLDGAGGNDTLFGGANNDVLSGGAGADQLFGGAGNGLIGSGADLLQGLGGNDFLDGENGFDTLEGGSGNDTIVASRGNDDIDGGSDTDLVQASGTLDQYVFSLLSADALQMRDTIAGRDGKDQIENVEVIVFKDGYELSLTGGNNNPYAVADTAATTEDAAVLIDVLANDFDPDQTIFGKATTLSLVSVGATAEGGTATISAGKVLYDPGDAFDFLASGETATDTFDYTISDGKGGTWTTSVTVTITGTGGPLGISLSDLDGETGFRLIGIDLLDQSGRSVSSAGDVNGDGFDDLIVGAPYATIAGGVNAEGESYVVFGKASWAGTPSLDLATLNGTNGFRLNGIDAYDFSGSSVSSAGDVNGDGFDDVIIGAFSAESSGGANAEGESYVVFGKASWAGVPSFDLAALDGKNGFRLIGADANDQSGRSVSSAGDVNGDGFADVIVGAFFAESAGGAQNEGESYVVFGKASWAATPSLDLAMLDGTNGFRLIGIDASDLSGVSVSSAGDVNGDGFADLIVGAQQAESPGGAASEGESYVVFGKASWTGTPSLDLSTLDGTNGFRLNGIDAYDFSGVSVSSAGDVNGDGFADLIVGAIFAEGAGGAQYEGESYVVFGKASWAGTPALDLATLDGTNGFRLIGADGNDQSGYSVSSAGDVNGDGFADLIVGAPLAEAIGGGESEGESYLVFGKASWVGTPALDLAALDGINGIRLIGVDAYDLSGRSVSSAGDVNGDGFADVIVGAPQGTSDGGADAEGESYVVFGGNFAGSAARLANVAETSINTPQLSIADVLALSDETPIGGSGGATEISVAGKESGVLATGGQTWQLDLTLLPIDPDSGP
jgi:VCBS repeat-containing protein